MTRSLGSDPGPAPDLWLVQPAAGDRYLVCSDGLTGELEDPAIAELLAANPDPQAAADQLIGQALAAGGNDNVTAVVLDVLEVRAAEPSAEQTAAMPAATAVLPTVESGLSRAELTH